MSITVRELEERRRRLEERVSARRAVEVRTAKEQAALYAEMVADGTLAPGSKAARLFRASVERRLRELEGKPVELVQERKLCAGGLVVVGGRRGR